MKKKNNLKSNAFQKLNSLKALGLCFTSNGTFKLLIKFSAVIKVSPFKNEIIIFVKTFPVPKKSDAKDQLESPRVKTLSC